MLREYHKGAYPYEYLREVMFGGQDYEGDFHYNMFMPEQLSMLLREAGFQEIQWPVRGRVNGKCFEMLVSATCHTVRRRRSRRDRLSPSAGARSPKTVAPTGIALVAKGNKIRR
jgi:hypothetical protein